MKLEHTLFVLFGLGLYHGINPAMGWLLAASQGLQKKSLGTLLGAIGALSAGHFAAIGAVVFGYKEIQKHFHGIILEWAVASLLIGFGAYQLLRKKHRAWLGMRSGLAAVAFWSFLIATAHGAGIMLLPFVTGKEMSWPTASLVILVHTSGYLAASLAAALFLYGTLNLKVLKNAWINFDLLWPYSLLLTGVFLIFFLFSHSMA